ncbi:MAG: sulfatase family protein, partial [Bryobacteraceae bacterium]
DAQIGRVLAELERTGMADNTILVFTADHGNMLGDHGRWFKGLMYEGSVRVPLLWRGPKGALENTGSVHNELIENIDVMPSLLESIGVPVPDGVQGRSFLRLARGESPGWKNRCYSQLWTGMIRTPEWKFIDKSRNLSGPLELYRMTEDPHESRNLAGESKYRSVVADFKRELTAWRANKPAPVRIKGMPLPGYATISNEEREELLRTAPGRR